MTIPVAILGATGYAGEGALRLLLSHPDFTIVHAGSDRLAGQRIGDAVPSLTGLCDIVMAEDTPEAIIASGAQAIVLAKKSPDVTRVVPELIKQGIRIVDIGAEFRLRSLDDYKNYHGGDHACPELLPTAVYGLSEIYKEQIASASVVGNPGCYPTSILLPLIPLIRSGCISMSDALVSISYSGMSGAGKRFIESNNNLFYAMNENMHSYKTLDHQHTAEIDQEISVAAGTKSHISFVPHLAPITRGIHSSISATLAEGQTEDDIRAAWNTIYGDCPFIRIRENTQDVEVANVTGTNFCDFSVTSDKHSRTIVITSVIDNLIKGASGQAVQNLNIMFGLNETSGLL